MNKDIIKKGDEPETHITANNSKMNQSDTTKRIDLVKSIAAKGATQTEFELLQYMSSQYGLDPLMKEIWCIKRNPNEPALIMTSRDGYLKVAHTSGQFDGLHSGTIKNERGEVISAWCEVWRKDMSHSFKSEVELSEYRQTTPVWNKYTSAMLIKVAEVFALKRAFHISGMVTQEEVEVEPIVMQAETIISTEQLDKISNLLNEKASDPIASEHNLEVKYAVESLNKLTAVQGDEVISFLEKQPSRKETIDQLPDNTEELFEEEPKHVNRVYGGGR